ncbi:MAG: hypothetical protein R3F11_18160, partial [Verrucomicrobiales bacterium]
GKKMAMIRFWRTVVVIVSLGCPLSFLCASTDSGAVAIWRCPLQSTRVNGGYINSYWLARSAVPLPDSPSFRSVIGGATAMPVALVDIPKLIDRHIGALPKIEHQDLGRYTIRGIELDTSGRIGQRDMAMWVVWLKTAEGDDRPLIVLADGKVIAPALVYFRETHAAFNLGWADVYFRADEIPRAEALKIMAPFLFSLHTLTRMLFASLPAPSGSAGYA